MRTLKLWRFALLATLTTFGAAGCGSSEGEPSDSPNTAQDSGAADDGDTGAEPGQGHKQTIGSEGGTIEYDGLSLDIPPGALSEEVEIAITKLKDEPGEGFVQLSPMYRFEPESLEFAIPVSVRIPFSGPAKKPGIYWASVGDPFERIGGAVDGNAVTGQVSHFSLGFVGEPKGSEGDSDLRAIAHILFPAPAGNNKLTIRQVEALSNGDVIVQGDFDGSVDLGGQSTTFLHGNVLARYSSSGTLLWLKDEGDRALRRMATLPNDDIVYAERYSIRLLDSMGNEKWRVKVNGDEIWPRSIAVGEDGRIAVVGILNGKVDLGGGELRPVSNDLGQGSFLAIFDSKGKHLFSKGYFGTVGMVAHDRVVAAQGGGFIVAGAYSPEVDLGGGQLPKPKDPYFSTNVHLARFDASGAHQWSTALEVEKGNLYIGNLVSKGDDDVALMAGYSKNLTIGQGAISTEGEEGTIFFNFNAKDGALKKHRIYPGAQPSPSSFDGDAHADDFYITGRLSNAVDFGGGAIPPEKFDNRGTTSFLAVLGTDGSHRLSKAWAPTVLSESPLKLAQIAGQQLVSDKQGGMWWFAGYWGGEVEVTGDLTLPESSAHRYVLVRFAP